MTNRRTPVRVAIVAFIGVVALLGGSPRAQQPGDAYVPGELIVQFRAGVTEGQRQGIRDSHAAVIQRRYTTLRIERLRIPDTANPIALAQAFSAHPEVEAAQPNFIRHSTSVASPNDPFYVAGNLWGLSKISAPVAWGSFGAGTNEVIVADIDTGVSYNHPDLAAHMWHNPGEVAGNGIDDDANGYVDDIFGIDAVNNDSDPFDDHGHGTHTSGTFGAVSDNGIGVAAVAPNVKILACKFLNANGSGSDADAIECLNYVVSLKQRGVNIRVTSNSWGGARGQVFPNALKNAFDAAGAAGIINIVAAGNDGVNIDSSPQDPASFTSASIVSVAASDSSDARANFSNYGAVSVDLAAPGVSIVSTYTDSGYATASGTSMATPHVAGAAAMLLAHRPALTVSELKNALLNSVDPLGQWTGLVASGGRLNVYQAINIAPGGGGLVNVAAGAAGATASASSSYSSAYPVAALINGDRRGLNWDAGGGWADATPDVFPDWVEVTFTGAKTLSAIDVFTLQDTHLAPSEPTPTMTFTKYGVRDFEVQYWTGAAWQPIPGATVTGNTLVWRHVAFTPLTTTKIRVVVNFGLDHYSNLTEVEAWGTTAVGGNNPPTVSLTAPAAGAAFTAPASIALAANASDDGTVTSVSFYYGGSNLIGTDTTAPYVVTWTNVPAGNYTLTAVALDNAGATTTSSAVPVTVNPAAGGGLVNVAAGAAGATVSASSSYSSAYPVAALINGDRRGVNWDAGGGWADATPDVFPDWVEVTFTGAKTISAIDVFTLQDTHLAPSEPTPTMTFTKYGVRDFEVQYWTGAAWQPIPGATVTGNTLVWRHVTFTPLATTKIRVVVSFGLDHYSNLTEVEAWGN